jgi:hypothetical protein
MFLRNTRLASCPRTALTRFRFGVLATAQIAVAMCAVSFAAEPGRVLEDLRRVAVDQGRIPLGEIAAFKDTYLAGVIIQTPRIEDDGTVAGTATFAGSDAPLLLQYVEGPAGGIGRWLLAWRLPTQNLGQLIPAAGDVAGQHVRLATPIVIFSQDRMTVSSASMAPAVRDFYREVYGAGDFSLSIQNGVNLVSSIDVQGELLVGLKTVGAEVDSLVLEGVLLKNFDAETFRKARTEGRLTSTAVRDAELKAKLARGTLSGLPAEFQIVDLALLITGKPSAGVAFALIVGSGTDQRRFECRGQFLGASAGSGGRSGFSISAHSDDDRPWRNALGIQGLLLHSTRLEMRNETGGQGPPRMLVGVNADLQLAAKKIGVAGGMTTRRGVPSVFLQGSIDSLTRDDLVAVANDLSSVQHGRVDARVVGAVLPDFDLRQVEILYAPTGGSDELGVPSGVGLKGQLYLFGSQAAAIEGLIDISSPKPRTSIKATVSQFRIGPLTLHDTNLDVLMAIASESHFRASGGCDLLGARVVAKADLNAQRSEVVMSGRVAGAFEADVTCTGSPANASWQFSAGFKDDFSNAFRSQVSEDILAWARQAEQDFNKTNADLAKAKQDVAKINSDIAKAQAQVQRDREINEAALRRAEADVSKINSDISNMRAQVHRERELHLGEIRKAKADVDRITGQINARRAAVNAQRERDLAGLKSTRDRAKAVYDKAEMAYRSALAAWQKAKGLDKIKKGIDKDAKGIDRDVQRVGYQAKAKAYDVARAAMYKVPVDADPQIAALFAAQKVAQGALDVANASLRKIHGTAPIDADPRVAGLFVGRDAALAGVRSAKAAFDLAHRVPIDADPRVAPLFVARDGATASLDAAQLAVAATGDAVQWGAKATAAAASGQLLRVQSARLTGELSALQQAGQMELAVALRVMDQPQNLRLAVNSAALADGSVFKLAAARIRPGQKPASSAVPLAAAPNRMEVNTDSPQPRQPAEAEATPSPRTREAIPDFQWPRRLGESQATPSPKTIELDPDRYRRWLRDAAETKSPRIELP